jgi:hypothetical protein
VPVRRGAAAEEAQHAVGRGADLVPRARRDQDRVAAPDVRALAVDLDLAAALDEVVELLALAVVVALRRPARPERRLGEALVAGARGGEAEELADRAPVGRRERLRVVQ